MNTDGSCKTQITQTHYPSQNPFQGSQICWSPDGKWISFTMSPNGDSQALNHEFKTKKPTDDIIVHK